MEESHGERDPATDGTTRGEAATLFTPRFVTYLAAQFLGALNDNAFKLTLVLFALRTVEIEGAALSLGSAEIEAQKFALSNLAAGLFPLPWLLFSQAAGYLADRYRKDRVLLATKVPEVVFMALGAVAFHLESVPLLFVAFLLMSTQSAVLSPAKYGILPEVVPPGDLAFANGLLSMITNIAVLLGTLLGVALYGLFQGELVMAGAVYVALGIAGTVAMAFVPVARPGTPAVPRPANPVAQARVDFRVLRAVKALPATVLGLAYFSFLGSFLLALIPVWAQDTLGLGETASGYLLVPLVIGVAAGSLVAGRLSEGRVEIGLVPLGALPMAVFAVDLLFASDPGGLRIGELPVRAAVDLFGVGVGAGFFSVPLTAQLQQRSPADQKGQLIGFSNVVSNLAILVAALCGWGLSLIPGFDIRWGIGVLAAIAIGGSLHILAILPDFLLRLVVYLMMNTFYRLRVSGAEHIPRGGALFVANHVSWIDALLVTAASGRMVRFMMFRPFYELRPFHWLFKRLHVIPVAGGDDPQKTAESLALARAEIESGHTVCIFAEGAITRTGNLLGFRRGLERIAYGLDAPIVPVCLSGVWGSLWSFEGGKVLFKRPRGFRHPIRVLFGRPIPSSSTAFEVREAVQSLSVSGFVAGEVDWGPLPYDLLLSVRSRWRAPFVADASGLDLTYGETLRAAVALRMRALDGRIAPGDAVGVALPTGVPAAVSHLAVLLAGAVPICLPPGAPDAARTALAQSRARLVLVPEGSRDYADVEIERVEVGAPAPEAAPAWLGAARWLPVSFFSRLVSAAPGLAVTRDSRRRAVERPAAVVFTRGTTGPHKAIVLSHLNLLANLRAFRQVFDFEPEDCVLGVLSFAHSFGVTGTLLLPGFVGARVVYAPDPMDAATIDAVSRAHRPTVLFATPIALARYARSVSNEAFAAMRRVVSGGSVLTPALRETFTERFATEPLEGYGLSECAPLVSLNVPDVEIGRAQQSGSRPGTIGHPLPGVAVRVVEPDSGERLGIDQPGRLLVRGPNVMRGYLADVGLDPRGAGSATAPERWHDTGDIASVDRDGFLRIVDRADRVIDSPDGPIPIHEIEAALTNAIGIAEDESLDMRACVLADTSGRPVILYQRGALDPATISDAPELQSLPAAARLHADSFVAVDTLPRLDSGAIDRTRASELATGHHRAS